MGRAVEQGAEDGPERPRHIDTVYLAGLRQDLDTPITGIIGYAEMLLEDAGPDEDGYREDLGKILDAGRGLESMVHQLFDAKMLEQGEFDPTQLGSSIRHELRTPLNHIIGYAELLIEEAEDAGQNARRDDLRKIRSSGKILLELIEDLLSTTEQATELELSGSELTSVASAVASSFEKIEDESRTDKNLRGRLLVVDDNEINRDMLTRRLTRQGHEVETAAHGRAALAMLKESPFDLVLLDILMPELNGYQVLEAMKQDEAMRHIPVIMVTALNEMDSTVLCIKMGAEDYLHKPFNPTLLKARVEACLEKKKLRDREAEHLARIEDEQRKSDGLLRVILPDPVVEELKQTDAVRPRRYDGVAVLFTDVVGFTPWCEGREPEEVVARLQELVEEYERIARRFRLQKIKTIGDAFMGAAGLLDPVENPVLNSVQCGLEMIRVANELQAAWNVRIGIHVGPVVAGVLGKQQYLYDLVGDTVNTASRMESHGTPGAITLSRTAWDSIDAVAEGESRGVVQVKGKGEFELMRFVRFKPGAPGPDEPQGGKPQESDA